MSNAASPLLRKLQQALADLDYYDGLIDGLWGPKTDAAMVECRAAKGAPRSIAAPTGVLPWIAEARKMMGRNELRDRPSLMAWLRSDGRTLGDPSKLPWCGDFVETAIRLALPAEPFPGELGRNPYWARNWRLLGIACEPCFGAVLSFARGDGGHVGFAVGADASAFEVLGGNQSNGVTVARIAKDRLLASRWPATFPFWRIALSAGAAGAASLSLNEQ